MSRQLYFAGRILIGVNFYISPVRRRSLNNLLTSVYQRQGIRLFRFLCQGGKRLPSVSCVDLHNSPVPVVSVVPRFRLKVWPNILPVSYYWFYHSKWPTTFFANCLHRQRLNFCTRFILSKYFWLLASFGMGFCSIFTWA